MGSISQALAWVVGIAWVHKILAWVKENGRVEILVWVNNVCMIV